MGYRVRNQDGELQFKSFDELRDAYLHSMVGPEDEVQEDGSSSWRKAAALPALARLGKEKAALQDSSSRWYLIAVGMAVVGAGLVWAVVREGIYGFAAVLVVALVGVGIFSYVGMNQTRRRR